MFGDGGVESCFCPANTISFDSGAAAVVSEYFNMMQTFEEQ